MARKRFRSSERKRFRYAPAAGGALPQLVRTVHGEAKRYSWLEEPPAAGA